MSWVKRLVGSRPFQKATGIVAAEYLRLVWKTNRFVVEPEGIYEHVDRDAPVIIAMWHGQHFLMPFVRRPHHRVKVLVSRHRDGEINALAAERLGIVKLASASGRPIYPIAIATRRRLELKNWDRTAINLPFGRAARVAGEPIRVPADADGAALETARRAL